ncbi:hypothetical protein H5410_061517 [Solanum commersonii]|uniref:Uncharacterized protein n=1 Tax=Solanum commersonii TaxID=4109 RepID=A0A9J5W8V7_SOLCO|nr:hypothetical protein H5410_061517 [Solanum commersonii]
MRFPLINYAKLFLRNQASILIKSRPLSMSHSHEALVRPNSIRLLNQARNVITPGALSRGEKCHEASFKDMGIANALEKQRTYWLTFSYDKTHATRNIMLPSLLTEIDALCTNLAES